MQKKEEGIKIKKNSLTRNFWSPGLTLWMVTEDICIFLIEAIVSFKWMQIAKIQAHVSDCVCMHVF